MLLLPCIILRVMITWLFGRILFRFGILLFFITVRLELYIITSNTEITISIIPYSWYILFIELSLMLLSLIIWQVVCQFSLIYDFSSSFFHTVLFSWEKSPYSIHTEIMGRYISLGWWRSNCINYISVWNTSFHHHLFI